MATWRGGLPEPQAGLGTLASQPPRPLFVGPSLCSPLEAVLIWGPAPVDAPRPPRLPFQRSWQTRHYLSPSACHPLAANAAWHVCMA